MQAVGGGGQREKERIFFFLLLVSFFLFMNRSRDKEHLFDPDPEPKRTLRRNLQQIKAQHSGRNLSENFEQEAEDMVEPVGKARKVLGDFTMPTSDLYGRRILPAIRANNFELKPQLVSLLQ